MTSTLQWQHTLREKISVDGQSLHDGQLRRLEILGAPADTGIVFVRTDLPHHPELRAHVSLVGSTTLATTLCCGRGEAYAEVATVEHLLAAFSGLGIDNARVLIDGPELPILDGSAKPFVELMRKAGLETLARPRRYLVVKREVKVQDGPKVARIAPSPRLRITCSLDFDHPLIGELAFVWEPHQQDFARELAPARTFGFLADVNALKARGLALGGSLENAVVIDDYAVLNPEGLRFADEFVRHKTLDALGDIFLFGMPVVGKLNLHRSGHALNTALVREVLSDARNFEVVTAKGPVPAHAALGQSALDYLGAAKGIA